MEIKVEWYLSVGLSLEETTFTYTQKFGPFVSIKNKKIIAVSMFSGSVQGLFTPVRYNGTKYIQMRNWLTGALISVFLLYLDSTRLKERFTN